MQEFENIPEASLPESKPEPAPKKRVVKKRPAKPKPVKKPLPPAVEAIPERPKPKPIVFTTEKERPAKRRSPSRFVPVLASILGLGILVAFVVSQKQFAKESADQSDSDLRTQVEGEVAGLKERLQLLADELQKQKEAKQETKYSEYTNDDLGIRFHYPQNLGQANAQMVDPDAEKDGDEYLTVTFSANPDIWLAAADESYKGKLPFVYNGQNDDLAATCPKPLDVSEDGYCDLIGVLQSQTALRVQPLIEEKLLNVVKSVPINLQTGTYSGLTVNVGLGLPPVTGRDLFAPTSDDKQQEALTAFYRNLIKRESLSIVVLENLKAHETILNTIQFNALPATPS